MQSGFKLSGRVFLAPMAGITDAPMRRMLHRYSAGKAVAVSEMVAVNALSRKNPKTYRIADVRDEPYPVIVQLEGRDPVLFADAARLAEDLGAAGIDLNMGCPVRKIITSGAGSALMREPKVAAEIISAVRAAVRLPVSVKFRKGWDNEHVNAVEFARMCEQSGASYITVHGRTRAQGYSGSADWEMLKAVKVAVGIPVIGNGDILNASDALRMQRQTGVDAVMVGRAALGAPWLLGQIADFLADGKAPTAVSTDMVRQALLEHVELLKNYYGEALALALSRKYICWYSKNFYEAKRFRENYMKIGRYAEAVAAIESYFETATREEG